MNRNFIWGHFGGNKKNHGVSWEKLCSPKEEGGLQLRNLRFLNLALLGKLGWRLLMDTNHLWVDMLQKKYLRDDNLMTVTAKSSDSHVWRSILKARYILEKGLGKVVTNGIATRFWVDSWLDCGPLIDYANRDISNIEANLPVVSFCDESGQWDLEYLNQVLPLHIVLRIVAVLIDPKSDKDDATVWIFTSNGEFTVNSAYKSQQVSTGANSSFWKTIWKLPCSRKVCLFIWRVLHNSLPTGNWLSRRNMSGLGLCPRYELHEETILHAMDLNQWVTSNILNTAEFEGIPWNIIFIYGIWLLWYWRNLQVFNASFVWLNNDWSCGRDNLYDLRTQSIF
ncbi:Ribonuclease H protein, putative [Theobroma cacao]|uniref:Ribonuclease H protein, putative n=1 Tax=Theobroma cacao TaxID=3641 RepID=A0A061GZB8_THECC|nr:Ribonuclease H protein, putative [Theobroma cacao]